MFAGEIGFWNSAKHVNTIAPQYHTNILTGSHGFLHAKLQHFWESFALQQCVFKWNHVQVKVDFFGCLLQLCIMKMQYGI